MARVPRGPRLDSTAGFLAGGYTFISSWCDRLQTDIFASRLLLRDVVFFRGEAAARAFYQPGRFTRRGAMPTSTIRLLQDKGSVQLLDGEAHRVRKAMFMAMMSPAEIARLVKLVDQEWRARLPIWAKRERVVLHDEARAILCQAACDWIGLPLPQSLLTPRTRELGAMIDNAGKLGPRNWWATVRRWRTEDWISEIIEWVRAGSLGVDDGNPLYAIAWHRNEDGSLLSTREATVEALNLLRPIVAIAEYIVDAAQALHDDPGARAALLAGDETDLECFAQEVRRYYPFFPFIGGRALVDFDWGDYHFTRGTWVVLDLYGTNHEAATWGDPDVFRPDRFRDWHGSAFDFVPQGGGDYFANHRCPGEEITVAVLKQAIRLLTTAMTYDVPPQDLSMRLNRIPATPKSGFVITNVRAA